MMYVLNFDDRNAQLAWAESVLAAIREFGDDQSAKQVQSSIEQYRTAPFSIAVLGKVKRGKSTLINALLGRRDDLVAPIDRLPASSAISRFRWRDRDDVTVLFQDGRKESIPITRIRDFATEELNPQNAKAVELLEVAASFPGLDKELELVDTPGAGSLHEHHDTLLHAFIPQADAVIFLVTARMPLDQDELDLLRHIKAADISKVFFAINRVDEATETDLNDAATHNLRLLAEVGISVNKIYRVSAKRAFQGDFEGSGLPELLSDVREFLATQKGRVLADRLRSRITQAALPVLQALTFQSRHARKSREELETERRELAGKKLQLTKDREFVEREFRNSWNRTLLAFEQSLRGGEVAVQSKIARKVSETGLIEVGRLAKQLPTMLQQTLDEELASPVQRLEREMLAATQKLQAEYPHFDDFVLDTSFAPSSSGQSTVIQGAATGAVLTALGTGSIAAGSAAAASIAAANATALTATTSVAAPSVIGTMLANVPHIGGMLASLGTGTATVSAPTAFTATPLWVAMSGPVGWTLVGIGVLTVPFAWRVAKIRAKDQLLIAAREQVSQVFRRLREDRINHLRQLADSIVGEFQVRLERQLFDVARALDALSERPLDAAGIAHLESQQSRLQALLHDKTSFTP